MAIEQQQTVTPNPKHLMDNQMACSFIHNNNASNDANLMPTYINLAMPTHPVEFQTSEACPKNFIIFDQNFNGSQVTFHPTIAPKFCYPGLDEKCQIREAVCIQSESESERERKRKREVSCIKEDSDDIDALLMSSEEIVGSDEDEVSTGRTVGNYGGESPDSDSRSTCSSSRRRNGNSSRRKKTRNMVKMLKRIVPGGDRMSTADVLDGAVKYLKSLKGEAMKLGNGNKAV
ncbi:transcription factor bHLH144 [Impatiens glandulifera]|uniref:transcription factor bHLH144 n=1 Tax=Impatiens glandulifera TaxID=253017 RepID=UPI001FB1789F|nr:transcription factor bHLH144 [Impatiens glandulifera]XP_047329175.1 transcription factor bHLH144 [Impatiens glandulifera]